MNQKNFLLLKICFFNELLNTYGISGVPVIYLIDGGGKVIYIREDEKKDLDKLIALNTLLTEYLGK